MILLDHVIVIQNLKVVIFDYYDFVLYIVLLNVVVYATEYFKLNVLIYTFLLILK